MLALGFLMDYAQHYMDLGVSVPVGAAACMYIVLMECGSILENLCQTNPELMPDKLCEIFGVVTSSTTAFGGGPPSPKGKAERSVLRATEQQEKAKILPMEEESDKAEEERYSENQ